EPGASKTIRVIFGFSDGHKAGYQLNPREISQLLFFTGKNSKECAFRVVSLTPGGKPGEGPPADPEKIRVKPKDGVLLGKGVAFATEATGGARAEPEDGKLLASFSGKGQAVTIKPEQGRWDLREAHQVRIKIRNTGSGAVAPAARVESAAGPTDKVALSKPLKAGESGELVVSFIPAVPWTGEANAHTGKEKIAPGRGTRFLNDAVSGVTIFGDERGGEQKLVVESITAAAPPGTMPNWLGKRPPVEGEWVPTFQEEFDGNGVNLSKWNVYTANYWDKLSHFSKDNVIVKNGVAILRYEKKTGRHNDDPKGAETPYATGFLDTYGKWVQRYGYFEARMKLPKAPGLWPAMWLMPDRGLAKGEQWKRASTGEGGMEFDIMEYLSRWGDHRFNIAFHWDGYGEAHRQTGTTSIYADHDREGFITSGLLWLPGKAVIYCNGREVARWESPRVSTVPSDIMFTHVMGGWDNNDLDDTRLPDDFVIDYVRCWQRRDLASDLDGVKSTQPTPAAPLK
ncbi:MAG TPA: glycoside hydrolase family 16 protein, partial [Verrucomicrobiales bacterium]|nr:glycoside hydrolase family 16 protein [Verrucomicrobiales bacterium]